MIIVCHIRLYDYSG